jgi:hypothetical protein
MARPHKSSLIGAAWPISAMRDSEQIPQRSEMTPSAIAQS